MARNADRGTFILRERKGAKASSAPGGETPKKKKAPAKKKKPAPAKD